MVRNIYPIITIFIIVLGSILRGNTLINDKYGVVLGTKVLVRESPNTKSKIVTVVKEGEMVEIIQWTNVKEKIGIHEDHWAKIKTQNNESGYIFGAFIFDLKNFIGKKWFRETCSGLIIGVIFENNNTFKIIGGCGELGCGELRIMNGGTYSFNKTEITLNNITQHLQIDKLYLFKYNQMNTLD